MITVGALFGVVVALFVLPDVGQRTEPPSSLRTSSGPFALDGTQSSDSLINESLTVYRASAEFADVQAIVRSLGQSASASQSFRRDLEIEALLLRLLELEPVAAVNFVTEDSAGLAFADVLFQMWLSLDPDAAMNALGDVTDAELRRRIAIALVGSELRNRDDIELLAAVVDETHSPRFLFDAIVRLADVDPVSALSEAANLVSTAHRTEAFAAIATAWARTDPPTALAHLEKVSEPLDRDLFHIEVLKAWAFVDPGRAIEYVASAAGQELLARKPNELVSVASSLAAQRPHELFAAADSKPGMIWRQIRLAALRRIVDMDMASAIAEVEMLPGGERRSELFSVVAAAYVHDDPDNAMRWIRSTGRSFPQGFLREVGLEVARVDPVRAMELMLEDPRMAVQTAGVFSRPDILRHARGDQFREMASMVEAAGSAQRRTLTVVISAWSRSDPDGAWNWLLEQSSADDALMQLAGTGFASHRVEISPHDVARLPPDLRGTWITAFAGKYAQTEPEAAVDWLYQLHDEPDYGLWASEVVEYLTSPSARGPLFEPNSPRPAAAIIDTMHEPALELVASVAGRWAAIEPVEAVEWASSLADSDARAIGLASAIGAWTVTEPEAARQWAFRLPGGDTRDAVLGAALAQGIASHDSVDLRTLQAFSSEQAVKAAFESTGMQFAFRSLGSRNLEAAERLLVAYVDDPMLRQQILDDIARVRSTGRQARRDSTLIVAPN